MRYEFGICIQTGWIVWVNGPYPAGEWSDLAIARSSLMQLLEPWERFIADGGYRDRSGSAVTPTGQHAFHDRQRATVRARQETVHGRLKCWGALSQRCRHGLQKHGIIVHSIATITQLSLMNSERTFDVDYEEQI